MAVLGLALADRTASGQTIRGSVLDADTNAGIPQVLMKVIRREKWLPARSPIRSDVTR
jgi:hypothetical protein